MFYSFLVILFHGASLQHIGVVIKRAGKNRSQPAPTIALSTATIVSDEVEVGMKNSRISGPLLCGSSQLKHKRREKEIPATLPLN